MNCLFVCLFVCLSITDLGFDFSEPVKLSHKLSVWAASPWNLCDAAAVIEFHIAFGLRFYRRHFDVGRVLLCLNIVFW